VGGGTTKETVPWLMQSRLPTMKFVKSIAQQLFRTPNSMRCCKLRQIRPGKSVGRYRGPGVSPRRPIVHQTWGGKPNFYENSSGVNGRCSSAITEPMRDMSVPFGMISIGGKGSSNRPAFRLSCAVEGPGRPECDQSENVSRGTFERKGDRKREIR